LEGPAVLLDFDPPARDRRGVTRPLPLALALALAPALLVLPAAWAEDGDGDEPVDGGGTIVDVKAPRDPDEPVPLDTASAVTVVQVEDQRASADVAGAVASVPGVHVQRLGGLGDYSVVTIRGSSARQVEVFVDGVPLNPHGGSAVNLSELPLDAFERVEVYRSGAPAHLGSAAMGGVVNLVTAPGEVPPPRLEVTAGSFWTGRMSATAGRAGELGSRKIPADLLISGEAFATDGRFEYFDDRGTVYNLFDDQVRMRENADVADVSGRIRARIGTRKLRLTVQDDLLWREQGLPGIGQDPALNTRLGASSNGLLVELTGRPHAVGQLRGRATWRARRETFADPEGELGVGRQDRRDRIHAVGGLIGATWTPLAWQSVSATVDLRVDGYQPVDALRDEPLDGTRTRLGLVLSAGDEISLLDDRIRFSPVLQLHLLDNRMLGEVPYESTLVSPDDRRVYAPFTPRLGVRVRVAEPLAIKANVGRTFRPPDFTELFGDRGAVVGNSELIPETGLSWDAGFRLESPADRQTHAALEASYFGRRLTDAIVYVQNAQRTQIPVNFGEARIHGVEAAGQLRLGGVVELSGSLTWLRSRNQDPREAYTGNQLPRVPEWEAFGELAGRWSDRLRCGVSLSHTAGNYWDATNWYLSAPRTLLGLFARVQPSPRWPYLELEVRNLTDRRLQTVPRDPLNPDDGAMVVQPVTDFTGYPLPGRTFLITIGGALTMD